MDSRSDSSDVRVLQQRRFNASMTPDGKTLVLEDCVHIGIAVDTAHRLMVPLDLSYGHRVITGADAARFVTHLAGLIAEPRRLLL